MDKRHALCSLCRQLCRVKKNENPATAGVCAWCAGCARSYAGARARKNVFAFIKNIFSCAHVAPCTPCTPCTTPAFAPPVAVQGTLFTLHNCLHSALYSIYLFLSDALWEMVKVVKNALTTGLKAICTPALTSLKPGFYARSLQNIFCQPPRFNVHGNRKLLLGNGAVPLLMAAGLVPELVAPVSQQNVPQPFVQTAWHSLATILRRDVLDKIKRVLSALGYICVVVYILCSKFCKTALKVFNRLCLCTNANFLAKSPKHPGLVIVFYRYVKIHHNTLFALVCIFLSQFLDYLQKITKKQIIDVFSTYPILAYTGGAPKGVESSNSNEKRTNRSRQLRGFFASRFHAGRVAIRKDARLTFRRFEASRHPLPDAPSNALVEDFEILEKERFMSNTIAPAACRVTTNGQPTTTTHDIAEVYGKRHDNVLSIVRHRAVEAGDWGVLNFWETPYINPQNGQTYQVIQMTKKGFYFAVGKFTGAKAVRHQIAFADEFERMESELAGGSALSLNQTLRSLTSQLRQPNGYPASLFAPLVQAYLEKTGQTLADAAALAVTAKAAAPAAAAIPLSAPPRLPGLSVSKLCDAQASAGDCRAITRFWQAYVAGDITGSAALPIPSRLLYWFYERWCADQGVYATGFAILIDHLKTHHGARVLRKRYQVRSVALGPHSFLYPRGTTKPAGKCESQWLGSCLQALQTKGGKWKLKL